MFFGSLLALGYQKERERRLWPKEEPFFMLNLVIEKGASKDCDRSRSNITWPSDGYYMAYKPITVQYISFMFIEMKFTHYHSNVMFAMKSMCICND